MFSRVSDDAPEGSDGVPEGSDGVPEGSDGVPKGSDGVPKGSDDVSEGSDGVPEEPVRALVGWGRSLRKGSVLVGRFGWVRWRGRALLLAGAEGGV